MAILARRGTSAVAIGEAMAIDMPLGPTWATGDVFVVVGSGRGTWLAWGRAVDADWRGELGRRLAGRASVSDQTGAYRMFQVEGPDACTLLQRGASIDLDELAFPAGSAALTVIGYVDVIIRSLPDGRSYEVAVYRSFAESFLRWIDATVEGLER